MFQWVRVSSRAYHSNMNHHRSHWCINGWPCNRPYRIYRMLHLYWLSKSELNPFCLCSSRYGTSLICNPHSSCIPHLGNDSFRKFLDHIRTHCKCHTCQVHFAFSMSCICTWNASRISLKRTCHTYFLNHWCTLRRYPCLYSNSWGTCLSGILHWPCNTCLGTDCTWSYRDRSYNGCMHR